MTIEISLTEMNKQGLYYTFFNRIWLDIILEVSTGNRAQG